MKAVLKQILAQIIARWLDQHLNDLFNLHRKLADLDNRVKDLEKDKEMDSFFNAIKMSE